ncbi:hypothetical protein CVIRNUC_003071 [Coccomyxa viridis]|uniref:50S ribosomal protein L35 n=1 Tax=Coccomyxa viridis TaxID=1274662 RepID=A0AAV1HXK0_9CHLO|nr:hypothetical protein CVIRNUC_003071 [Coccomyxa viridis]
MLGFVSALRPFLRSFCAGQGTAPALQESQLYRGLTRAFHGARAENHVILSRSKAWRHPDLALSSPGCTELPSDESMDSPSSVWRHQVMTRGFAACSKLRPKFTGGKLKQYSGFKERFKLTGTGKIRHMRTGHRHKRYPKTSDQNRSLSKARNLFQTYAITMKKLGFKRRAF